MATIITRAGKGSPLENAEVDANFTNLNTDKIESGDTVASLTITSADINGGTIDGVTIGGSSAGAITGTNLTATTSATLQHSSSTKLATTSTGIDVTGTVTADGLSVAGSESTNTTYFKITQTSLLDGVTSDQIKFGYNDSTYSSGFSFAPAYGATDNNKATWKVNGNQKITVTGGGDISFYEDTGTTAKFFWDASAESLGIGTSSPGSTKLYVQGSNAGQTLLTLYDPVYGQDFKVSIGSASKDVVFTGGSSSSAFRFVSGSSGERMRIDSSGRVGIGTSSPIKPLHVKHTGEIARFETTATTGNNYLTFYDASARKAFVGFGSGASEQFSLYNDETNGYFNFYNNGAERMRIDSSGNVGIGTGSPNAKLSLGAAVDAQKLALYDNNDNNKYGFGIQSNELRTYCPSNSHMSFGTISYSDGSTWSEKMRIDSSGNVGVGTSSPTHKFHLDNGTTDGTLFKINNEEVGLLLAVNGTGTTYGREVSLNATRVDAGSSPSLRLSGQGAIVFAVDANTERMRIDSSGRVTMPYQPAVTAYPSSTSITANGGDLTHLVFGSTFFNNGNHYNTSTGVFTCPVAGYYFVSANIRWETLDFAQTGYIRTFISKNDGTYTSTRIHVISGENEAWTSYMDQSISGVVYCAAGDNLRLKGGENGATDAKLHSESSFSVYLLG